MSTTSIPPMDLMFFLTESAQSPKHVGAVQIFQMPDNAPTNYLQDLVSQFRQAPAIAPFSYTPHFPRLGMPRWVESQEIDLDYHVRHSALPGPGTDEQLMEVIQRLHSTLLDRRRPCWTCQLIEGLEGNRFAVYSKIHHAYIDGMSGVKRMYGSLSTSPRDRKLVTTWSFDPDTKLARKQPRKAAPAGIQLVQQAKGIGEAYQYLTKMGLQRMNLREGGAQVLFAAKRTRLNKPIKWDSRSTAICTLPLDRIKRLGKAKQCTVNEVVLAIIGAALDGYLSADGETPKAPLVALCPMSIRSADDDSARTQVSAVHVRLGDPGASPGNRLDQVMASSAAAKAEIAKLSAEGMMNYGVMVFALWELLERSKLDQVVAPSYNVLVSNVPGPGDGDLYLCGSRMLASYPISTLLPGVNLNVTLLSHGNSLDFGLLADREALPDLGRISAAIVEQFYAMEKALLPATGTKPRARKKPASNKSSAPPGAKKKPVARKSPSRRKVQPKNRTKP